MSDEEKEALRNFKSEYETCDHYSSDLIIELDDAEIILNLIEKQSKEIEELKANKGYHLGFIDGGIAKRYEYEDKIKAKIEEIDKAYEDSKNEDGESEYYYPNYTVEVLQSLLEKE